MYELFSYIRTKKKFLNLNCLTIIRMQLMTVFKQVSQMFSMFKVVPPQTHTIGSVSNPDLLIYLLTGHSVRSNLSLHVLLISVR